MFFIAIYFFAHVSGIDVDPTIHSTIFVNLNSNEFCASRNISTYYISISVQPGKNVRKLLAVCFNLDVTPGTIIHWSNDLLAPETLTADTKCKSFFTYDYLISTQENNCARTAITISQNTIGDNVCGQGSYCIPNDNDMNIDVNISHFIIAVFALSGDIQRINGTITPIGDIDTTPNETARPGDSDPGYLIKFPHYVCIGKSCKDETMSVVGSTMPTTNIITSGANVIHISIAFIIISFFAILI